MGYKTGLDSSKSVLFVQVLTLFIFPIVNFSKSPLLVWCRKLLFLLNEINIFSTCPSCNPLPSLDCPFLPIIGEVPKKNVYILFYVPPAFWLFSLEVPLDCPFQKIYLLLGRFQKKMSIFYLVMSLWAAFPQNGFLVWVYPLWIVLSKKFTY